MMGTTNDGNLSRMDCETQNACICPVFAPHCANAVVRADVSRVAACPKK